MLIKPKLALVVLAMLFFINMAPAEDSLEKEEAVDTAPAVNDDQLEEEKASDEMEDVNQLQEGTKMEDDDEELANPESPEAANVETSRDELEDPRRRRRRRRVPCYCWIGWVRNKRLKYLNFGQVRSFRLFEWGKQRKCSASCSRRCAPFFKPRYYSYLCGKIGRTYHYKWHKVGCFSQVGRRDRPSNLWDFDGSPHGLCCKTVYQPC